MPSNSKEYAREYARLRRAADPAFAAAERDRNARYKRANRARCSERERLRKAGIRNPDHPQFIEPVDRRVVYEMHGGCCGICHEFIDGEFHVDHVVPLSHGGKHGYINVQPAHPICNQRKYDKEF